MLSPPLGRRTEPEALKLKGMAGGTGDGAKGEGVGGGGMSGFCS